MDNQNQSQDQNQPATENPASSGEPDWGGIQASIDSQFEPIEIPMDTAETGVPAGGLTADGLLTKDQFYLGFKGMFDVCGVIPIEPFPLKSMTIKPDEEEQARACSDAIYEIAEESPWLRFLLEPQGKWVPRLMAIGMFTGGKIVAVRTEIAGKLEPPAPKVPLSGGGDELDMTVFASGE